MTNATQLTPIEIQERLHGLNRRQRRRACREHWAKMEPWRDPEYAYMSRQEARDASWEAYWDAFKADNLKQIIETEKLREVANEQMEQILSVYPKALRPFFLFVGRLWRKVFG